MLLNTVCFQEGFEVPDVVSHHWILYFNVVVLLVHSEKYFHGVKCLRTTEVHRQYCLFHYTTHAPTQSPPAGQRLQGFPPVSSLTFSLINYSKTRSFDVDFVIYCAAETKLKSVFINLSPVSQREPPPAPLLHYWSTTLILDLVCLHSLLIHLVIYLWNYRWFTVQYWFKCLIRGVKSSRDWTGRPRSETDFYQLRPTEDTRPTRSRTVSPTANTRRFQQGDDTGTDWNLSCPLHMKSLFHHREKLKTF